MAFLEFKNVRIAGISAGVPEKKICNLDIKDISADYDSAAFVETTGVLERRVDSQLTASDLCVPAAEKLIADLKWDKSEIDALIFVSQYADYILPATACIIQDRIGLSKECYAMDIALGCSGWVYGLSSAASLLGGGNFKKVLLMVGDARRRAVYDDPLFGFAGAVTAIEYVEGEKGFQFHFGTDGSGFDAIIVPDGGARNQFTEQSLSIEDVEGKKQHRLQSRMKGMDVFSFGITTAPRSIKKLAEHYNFNYLDADFYVFHQANMKMNNMIAKKLKLASEKVPSCMYHFGNTSSASIPLTIVTQLKGKCESKARFVCCGFGVGLSWGTVAFDTKNIIVSELVEVRTGEADKKYVV